MKSIFNKVILKATELIPPKLVYKFAGRYVAGESIEDALTKTKELNDKGFSVTLDILGEHTQSKIKAVDITNQYSHIYQNITDIKLDCNISLKPSHIGLDISEEFCLDNLLTLLNVAKKTQNFLRIDMEDSSTTDTTLQLYKKCYIQYPNVGTVFQSYLHRTREDIIKLDLNPVNFRLCKGIYKEPPEIAIQSRNKINDNFLELLRIGFEKNAYIGIATHDLNLLTRIYQLIKEMKISSDQFEFQVLYGVPMAGWLEKHLANSYKVRIYVPFGPDWYNYSLRRLKENPNIAGYVLKNLFSNR